MCKEERQYSIGVYEAIDPAGSLTVKYLNGKEFATALTITELCDMLPDTFSVEPGFNGYDMLTVTKGYGSPSKLTMWDGTTLTDYEAKFIRLWWPRPKPTTK